jgi:hypothetical protein
MSTLKRRNEIPSTGGNASNKRKLSSIASSDDVASPSFSPDPDERRPASAVIVLPGRSRAAKDAGGGGDSPPPATPASQTTLSGRHKHYASPDTTPRFFWKANEMEYPKSEDWPDDKIYEYLISNAVSISPLSKPANHAEFCLVTNAKGETTKVTPRYRIPLVFLSKYQWNSLKQVMRSPNRQELWEQFKLSILYIAQLYTLFLEQANNAMAFLTTAAYKKWRSSVFDQSLVRYRFGILVNVEETSMDFWMKYDEKEYLTDLENIRTFGELIISTFYPSLLPTTSPLVRSPRCHLPLLPTSPQSLSASIP